MEKLRKSIQHLLILRRIQLRTLTKQQQDGNEEEESVLCTKHDQLLTTQFPELLLSCIASTHPSLMPRELQNYSFGDWPGNTKSKRQAGWHQPKHSKFLNLTLINWILTHRQELLLTHHTRGQKLHNLITYLPAIKTSDVLTNHNNYSQCFHFFVFILLACREKEKHGTKAYSNLLKSTIFQK